MVGERFKQGNDTLALVGKHLLLFYLIVRAGICSAMTVTIQPYNILLLLLR